MMTATDVFRSILSAAKALAVHHDVTNALGGDFDHWLGLGLGERFGEENPSEADYHMMGQALRFHCGHMAAAAFAASAEDRGIAMPFHEGLDSSFEDNPACPGRLLAPTMDIFGLASQFRASGEMMQEWGPFRGPAGVLWDAGMNGIDPHEPLVSHANVELARVLFSGTPAHETEPESVEVSPQKHGISSLVKRLFK